MSQELMRARALRCVATAKVPQVAIRRTVRWVVLVCGRHKIGSLNNGRQ